ncbi:MAG: hypothetical protein ACE5G0_03380 [Rhodothermales bacterium]
MRRLLGGLLAALLLSGCDASSPGSDPPIVQTILFEVEYVNFAWVPTWQGLYIDRQGSVYRYDLSDEDTMPVPRETYTEEELLEKYSHHKERIGQVDAEVLATHYALIRAAGEGALSEPVYRCADAGVVAFRAFRYDATTEHYTPVLLQQEGDVAQANRSASAQALVSWLRTVDEQFSNPLCPP